MFVCCVCYMHMSVSVLSMHLYEYMEVKAGCWGSSTDFYLMTLIQYLSLGCKFLVEVGLANH